MTLVALAVLACAFVVGLWAIQLRTRNAATADIGWTALVAAGAVAAAALSDSDPWRRVLVAVMATTWAVRLGGHLIVDRVLRSTEEDGRYRQLRVRWGSTAPRNFLVLYLAQVVVASLFIIAIGAAMQGGPLDAWAMAGAVVWAVAVLGEWMADRQLAQFRAYPSNRGQVCRTGLWNCSRHPNYFFEWLHWWAYVVVAQGAGLTFIGPAAMFLFLFRVTGIPYTEQQALRSRGEAYRAYQQDTSGFFPWWPRKMPS